MHTPQAPCPVQSGQIAADRLAAGAGLASKILHLDTDALGGAGKDHAVTFCGFHMTVRAKLLTVRAELATQSHETTDRLPGQPEGQNGIF